MDLNKLSFDLSDYLTKINLSYIKRRIPFAFLAAFAYASVLASLPLLRFMDRQNYLDYATQADAILASYAERGILAILTNEPLWLLVNVALGSMLPPEGVIRSIIFISAFLFAYFFLRADPKNIFWLVLFLFLPQILKNYITHLRQGLAISLFILAYSSPSLMFRKFGLLATPFIHSSFFFILILMIANNIWHRIRFAVDVRSSGVLMLAVTMGGTMLYIAEWMGARQGLEYSVDSFARPSGLGFAFWLFILVLMFFQGRYYLNRFNFGLSVVIFYLGTYFFSPVTARIFESGLPFVLLALLALTGWRKIIARSALLSYIVFLWGIGLLKDGAMF